MRRASKRAVVTAVLSLIGVAVAATPAYANGVQVGRMTITALDTVQPLNGGGSQTPFSVSLPEDAHCKGDSMTRPWYHIFGYLVKSGTDPGAVPFDGLGPKGEFSAPNGYPLIANESAVSAINVAVHTGDARYPDHFTWSRFHRSDLIPPGALSAAWEAGLACVGYPGTVSTYWNSDVVFTASASDPNGFTWAVVQPKGGGGSHTAIALAATAIAGGALIAVLVVGRRRSNHRPPGQRPAAASSKPGRDR